MGFLFNLIEGLLPPFLRTIQMVPTFLFDFEHCHILAASKEHASQLLKLGLLCKQSLKSEFCTASLDTGTKIKRSSSFAVL